MTTIGQSSIASGLGSKSTHAFATGCCTPLFAICTTTPDTVRNPFGDGSGAPVSAERETICALMEDLDGDLTIEPRVAGSIDHAHAPVADMRENLVRPEPVAGCQHGTSILPHGSPRHGDRRLPLLAHGWKLSDQAARPRNLTSVSSDLMVRVSDVARSVV